MDLFSHFFIGVLFGIFAINNLSLDPEYIYILGLMVILPDLDIIFQPLKKKFNSYYLAHKSASHSYVIALIISALIALIFSLLTDALFLWAWIVGFLGYGLHITLDLLTTSKIPALYPISKKEYRFAIDRAINPFLAMISGAFLLIFRILGRINADWNIFVILAYIFSGIYIFNFTYRIMLKLWVKSSHPGGNFIPGLIPFIYNIYEVQDIEDYVSFKLTKKKHLSSQNHVVMEIMIKKGTREMELYNKARLIGLEYRFFSKWEYIIPIIKEEEEIITIMLCLAESMANNRGYMVYVKLNKNTGEVIEKYDTFHERILTS